MVNDARPDPQDPKDAPDAPPSLREEEAALIERARDGEDAAFRVLVERYQQRVYGLAFGILRHREDAWDVAQEAFVKAYRNLGRFEGNSAFYTWLYRITYNLSMDALRSRARRDHVDIDSTRAVEAAAAEEAPLSTHPANESARKELGEIIQNAMSRLSDKHRAIIVLREVEGLSYEEMAQVLKISKGTVMSRLFHARRNLQALLEPYVERGELVLPKMQTQGA
jgi:RNA polymerase sigma-70 factor (ECF subfamily)